MMDSANQSNTPAISVIVPLYNEEENVERLVEAIRGVLEDMSSSYELLLVDDGSSDSTLSKCMEAIDYCKFVRVVEFRGNFGQTPAMAAGIDLSRGDVLVTMDGDLQNDPADIPVLVEKLDEGFDIVVGWRHKRQDKLITRKVPSMIANWIIGKVTGVPIKDNGCSLKAYRSKMIKEIPLYSEMHRFIPAMTSLSGAKVAEIKVRHHARQFGDSKYGLSRIYKVMLDLIAIKTIVGFSGRPLRWFGKLAIPFGLASLLILPFGLVAFIAGDAAVALNLSGLTLVLGSTFTFLIALGVLGELIYKTGNKRLDQIAGMAKVVCTKKGGSGSEARMELKK